MTKQILIFSMLFMALFANAQQVLPTQINTKLVLTQESSPYKIEASTSITTTGELVVEEGVTILINTGVTLTNAGRLLIKGTDTNPVLFSNATAGEKWKYIYNNGSLIARHLKINSAVRFVTSYGDTLIVENCSVSNTAGGVGDDLIGAHNANKIIIRNCYLEGDITAGKTDAIDLDGINNDSIVGNTILNFSDDGIDIGTYSKNVYIADNRISNCNMGVSVGESSTALLIRNVLLNNYSGIQSHTGSNINVDRNTIYGNLEGLRAFHNNGQNTSGGTINIKNSIITNCSVKVLAEVGNSITNIEYCLSDSILPAGTGNIQGSALFFDVSQDDFSLTSASPAIDKGKPDNDGDGIDFTQDADDRDADGTRLDLGYKPYFNAGLMVNEIMSSNLTHIQDEFKQYPDAIELFNNTDTAINLKGYYFSDSKTNLTKHLVLEDLIIPSKGFLVLWADNLERDTVNHLSFKLSGEGEFFGIADPNGLLIDGVEFGMIPNNISYGRELNTRQWVYFETPTFYEANTGESKYGVSEPPVFSNQGGESALPLSLELSYQQISSTIHFSVDGTNPVNGSVYESPILVDGITTVRALSKETNKITGYPASRIYYPVGTSKLPVFSLSTNDENLYGDQGIYTNYSSSGPLWERPVSIGFYDQQMKFSCTAGFRIQGGNSVHMAKKAFRLFFRGGYGTSSLQATPFKTGAGNFKNLVLRSGYDDDITTSSGTLIRDPLSVELWHKLGELGTKSDFVSLYLNNNYWGIYNIRESINEYFVESNMGISDFDLVRFQKWGNTLKYGSMDSWNTLDNFFETTDFSNPAAYESTAELMDMNSLLNLLAFVHCSQFRSWTWGAFGIKPQAGKWSWTIWDTDRAFSMLTWNGFTEYAITTNEKWPNIYPQKLMANQRFQHELINRTCDLLNTTFKPENSIHILDSLIAVIEPEIDNEYNKWNSSGRSRWETNLGTIRSFLEQRPNVVYQQIKNYFSISDTINVTLKIQGNGSVKLNSIKVSEKEWEGTYMSNIPIVLEAVPDFGSKFIRWENNGTDLSISVASDTNITIVAVFDDSITQTYLPLVINEIMYHPPINSGDEWIEIYNPNSYPVPLKNYKFSDGGVGNEFIFPESSSIAAYGYLVVASDLVNFSSYFKTVSNVIGEFGKGATGFSLSNSGETITLTNSRGIIDDTVAYMDNFPWPVNADGNGSSLQLINFKSDNSLPANWYASMNPFYSPGGSNPVGVNLSEGSQNALLAYPNPFSDHLIVELGNNYKIVDVVIYDLSGRQMSSLIKYDQTNNSVVNVNTSGLNKGVYLLKVKTLENGIVNYKTAKLIKN